MHVRDFRTRSEAPADLLKHPLLVVEAGSRNGFLRQVVFDVAVNQILDGRGGTPFALVAGWINTAINFFA